MNNPKKRSPNPVPKQPHLKEQIANAIAHGSLAQVPKPDLANAALQEIKENRGTYTWLHSAAQKGMLGEVLRAIPPENVIDLLNLSMPKYGHSYSVLHEALQAPEPCPEIFNYPEAFQKQPTATASLITNPRGTTPKGFISKELLITQEMEALNYAAQTNPAATADFMRKSPAKNLALRPPHCSKWIPTLITTAETFSDIKPVIDALRPEALNHVVENRAITLETITSRFPKTIKDLADRINMKVFILGHEGNQTTDKTSATQSPLARYLEKADEEDIDLPFEKEYQLFTAQLKLLIEDPKFAIHTTLIKNLLTKTAKKRIKLKLATGHRTYTN